MAIRVSSVRNGCLVLAVILAAGVLVTAAQTPVLRSGTETVAVAATVVARTGGLAHDLTQADFDAVWADQAQLARALDGLIADGLVDPLPDGGYALPGARAAM